MPPKKTTMSDNEKALDKFNKKKMEVVRGFKELKAELKAINSTAPKNVKKS